MIEVAADILYAAGRFLGQPPYNFHPKPTDCNPWACAPPRLTQPNMQAQHLRHVIASSALLALAIALAGCSGKPEPPKFDTSQVDLAALQTRIDAAVEHTLNSRTLNTKDHNAWQIVHGILPYGYAFQIDKDGEKISALEWLMSGGMLNGWNLRPGDKGVVAVVEQGSKSGQGHPDQWLGYLSQCGLKPDDKLQVEGMDFTVADLIRQAEWDIYPGMEATWTLMAFHLYFPLDHKWTAKDGQEWSMERLIEMEAGAPIVGEGSACGGTHRMYAISAALNRYLQETGKKPAELTGGWKKAYETEQDAIAKTKAHQQPDGSFSTNFFARPGSSVDIDATLHSTGHTLEWLMVALPQSEVEAPWVTAAVDRLCQLLEDNSEQPLDCGALYHAARGLMLYRTRRFGPREDASPMVTKAADDAAAKEPAAKASDEPPAPPQ